MKCDCTFCLIRPDDPRIEIGHPEFDADIRLLHCLGKGLLGLGRALSHRTCNADKPETEHRILIPNDEIAHSFENL